MYYSFSGRSVRTQLPLRRRISEGSRRYAHVDQAKYVAPGPIMQQAPITRAYSDPLRESLHTSAKQRVMELLAQGYDNYNPGELGPTMAELLMTCPVPKEQLAVKSFEMGQGTWEVFYAPHIVGMSSLMGTKFQIQYKLEGSNLFSYVKYSNPVLGQGWLNAAGSMGSKYDDTVEIKFDKFWVDGVDSLRSDITEGQGSTNLDSVIGMLGKSAFFPQFAVFPVLYLDEDLCVFKFPPLNSQIAVRRIA